MSEPVVIRRAEPADAGAIRQCVVDAYNHYIERIGSPPAPMLDDYDELVARGVVDIAVDADGLAGLIVMWSEPDHWYVDNIATSPRARGSGVGRQLLDWADDRARHAGHAEIRLYTNEVMTENLTYYARRGFVETHRSSESGFHRVYFTRVLPELDGPS